MENNLKVNLLEHAASDSKSYDVNKTIELGCILCDKIFVLRKELDGYLAHLYLFHRLVIADVHEISLIEEYLSHWKELLNDETLPTYCTTMLLNQLPDGTPSKDEKYFLLSDIDKEDADLRSELARKELNIILKQHQFELTDNTFKRGCIFCREIIEPTRADFVNHLYNKHSLQLGKPENLIFIDSLFDQIEHQMENLVCLFCEKVFKDRQTLKEHMRKKGHKLINPSNKLYDKYFMVNYSKDKPKSTNKKSRTGKSVKQVKDAKPEESDGDSDSSDWSDWKENSQLLVCLFCDEKCSSYDAIKGHMKNGKHEFDLEKAFTDRSFYEKIKMINYIRRQIINNRCTFCQTKHSTKEELRVHLDTEKHCALETTREDPWNQPEFFFPTFEDDALLYFIEEDTNVDNNDVCVFSEDTKIIANPVAESLSREQKLEVCP